MTEIGIDLVETLAQTNKLRKNDREKLSPRIPKVQKKNIWEESLSKCFKKEKKKEKSVIYAERSAKGNPSGCQMKDFIS